VECLVYSTAAAVTPGSGGTGDVTFPADVTVTGDIKAKTDIELDVGNKLIFDADADSNNYLYAAAENQLSTFVENTEVERKFSTGLFHYVSHKPNPTDSIDIGHASYKYRDIYLSRNLTDGTDPISIANIADLLMFGSANATWNPMIYEKVVTGDSTLCYIAGAHFTNKDATDFDIVFSSTLPMVKGGLKLYVTGLRLSIADADATNFVTYVLFRAIDRAGDLNLVADATDRTSADDYDYEFAAVDVSAYETLRVRLYCEVGAGADLDISSVSVRGYYAA